jgi:TRAP-type mannitol/chloroaromatic compound transport system permease small subunit
MIFGIYMMGGGIYSLLTNGHVRMDVMYSKFSRRGKAIMDCLTYPLLITFLSILFWKAFGYAEKSIAIREHSSTAWAPPIYLWKTSVPIIIGLFMLQSLANFIRDIYLAVLGKEL